MSDIKLEKRTEGERKAYLEGYNAGKAKAMRWIPVSDRLPEEDFEIGKGVQFSDFVLITLYNKSDDERLVTVGFTQDGDWWLYRTDTLVPEWFKVTAWMPLPEPYKGE